MASVASNNGDQIELNIMPMLDIFSILILFLLMSFSTDPVNHDVSKGLELAESDTVQSLDEIPVLILTKNELLVNDKKILDIAGDDVDAAELSQGAISKVYQELLKVAEVNKRFTKDKSKPGQLTMEIDKKYSFKIIRRLMLSAQQAEFVSFKLMVAKSQS